MLVLEYDGTGFLGFQRQKKGRTIQGELEKALFRILCEKVRVIPAGRTDSGVHARGQTVNIQTCSKIPLTNIQRALNACLPVDLAVREIHEAAPDFHARYGAKRKVYCYRILCGPVRSPLARFFAYHHREPLDISLMRKGASILSGKHDFRAFQARAGKKTRTVRTLYKVRVGEEGPFLSFRFEGDGFLYNMVRNMVGTLLWLGRRKISVEEFKAIVKGRDRRLAGPTAPPQGLTLEKVIYGKS